MALRLPETPEVEMRQRDLTYLLPGGLLVLAGVLIFHVWFSSLSEQVRGFFNYYPFLVLVTGVFLGWRFNRSRLIFSLFVLVIADYFIDLPQGEVARQTAVAAAELLIPLNLAMISFFVERGLFTRPGALRTGVILVQPLLFWLLHGPGGGLHRFLTQPLLHWPILDYLPLPQVPCAGLMLGGGILLVRFLWRPAALEAGFLWAVVATEVPLVVGLSGPLPTLWFATAGLVLTTSLIESSHRMAYRDELTGLPARRALNEELLKVGRVYAIAMVDIDHFKKFNDTHGHDVGDQVLKMVASHIEEVTGGGRPFRYGGEEFTVFFPGKTMREALPHLEDLRAAIQHSGFLLRSPQRPSGRPLAPSTPPAEPQRLSVTVSIGVAERNSFNHTPAEVIKAADKALYKAKEGGRNQVCRAGAKSAAPA